MAAQETDICNQALLRIGTRQLLPTSGPIAADTSGDGKVCAVVYPAARDALLARFRWSWAAKAAWLYEDGTIAAALQNPLSTPGWQHAFVMPADVLETRYVYDGARPGQPANPLQVGSLAGVTTVSQLPAINGSGPMVSFSTSGRLLFSDYSTTDGVPAYDVTATYALGAVVVSNGQAYVAKQGANTGHAVTDTAWWVATSTALLVYTAQVSDVTQMPQLFLEALTWQLAVDLALSIATKPQLAEALQKQADAALQRAMAAQAAARRPDPRPDSSFIAVRG